MLKYAIAACLLLCVIGCAPPPTGVDSLEWAQSQLEFELLVPEPPEGFALKGATIPSTGGLLPSFGNVNNVVLLYQNEAGQTLTINESPQHVNVVVSVPDGPNFRQIQIDGAPFSMQVDVVEGVTTRQIYYHRDGVQFTVTTTVSPEILTTDALVTMLESLQPFAP